MRAVRFAAYGGPEVLEVVEMDPPHPRPGEVRIAVQAAGVNPVDWKFRAGVMQQMMPLRLPAGSGQDAAGVVDEIGAGVAGVAVGDAVFGSGADTYSEHALLSAWTLMPPGLSFQEAAAYPVAVGTALRALDQVGVAAGQTLLVSGASGGVGSAVLQIARDRGITVIATASTGNQDYLRSMGAIATTYGAGLVQRVRSLAPHGVDAALDLAGSGVIGDLVELTGVPHKVVSIADFSAPEHGAQILDQPQDQTAALALAARLFTEGKLHIPVQQSFPLEHAADAHATSQSGHARGRLVITVRPGLDEPPAQEKS